MRRFQMAYKVATVWGIPIKLHVSLPIMVIFFYGHLTAAANFTPWEAVIWSIVLEAGLGISIILHELGHSLVAIRKGCPVREITLMCIGGLAQMERIPTRPRDELLMAAAGPAVSLVIGVVLIGLGTVSYHFQIGVLYFPLLWLGGLNLVLVVFNLIPAFPMDGGRILRAALTPRLGRLRATHMASTLGKLLAVCFGIKGYLLDSPKNWLLVAVAFFVYIAAGNEFRMVEAQEQIKSAPPWPFMRSGPPPPDQVIDDAVIISPPPYERGPDRKSDIHIG
ncbi:MAG: site-2 protease family protein [Verrucomicrobia bacterium]|nr:site-2 protease family protein [Verrucomicrobiota bacterium]